METSAKQPINVDEAFYSVVREIRKYNKVRFALLFIYLFREADMLFVHSFLVGAEGYPSSWWATNRTRSRRGLG